MLYLFLLFAALAGVCFVRPRIGLPILVAAGFIQDPVRKLVPEQPVVLVLVALGLYGAMVAGMVVTGAFSPLARSRTGRELQGPVVVFLGLVVMQAAHLYLRTGTAVLPAIGIASYAAPFVAGGVGFVIGLNRDRLLGFLRVYLMFGLAAALSVLVSRFFPDLRVFESVGTDLTVYGEAIAVRLSSGILRTPEVAAWHAATAGCVLLLLLSDVRFDRSRRRSLILGAAGLAVVVLAILWTGRRKALVEIVLFATLFVALSFRLRGSNRRMVGALLLGGGLLTYQLIEGQWTSDSSREAAVLTQRGGSTAGDATQRLFAAGSSVGSALRTYGLLGIGTGAAAQGAHHFQTSSGVRWEGEFGVGRLAAELGLAGLVLAAGLGFRLVAFVRPRFRRIARQDPTTARLATGLLSLLVSNLAVWVTAAQVFGDPFVYLILGTLGGSLLGVLEGDAPGTSSVREAMPESAIGGVPALKL